jgi:glyoxylase-like metal-dependent hydrolase (beta-lactamase superfamily II)
MDGWSTRTLLNCRMRCWSSTRSTPLFTRRKSLIFVQTLGKSIARLYITHYHPDHLLGAAAFSAPIFALQEVATKIDAVGDRVASEEHEKHGNIIPARARRADHVVEPGEQTIGGVRLWFSRLQHAETADAMVIGLPDLRILITQDLIYNKVHAFVGERSFDSWISALSSYETLPYERILPGHGLPGGKELFINMRRYLTTAQHACERASDPAELKRRMIDAFPDFSGEVLLDHMMRFLFPQLESRSPH